MNNLSELKDLVTKTFNDRMVTWYKNAELDHGINGSGEGRFLGEDIDEGSKAVILQFAALYTENGKQFVAYYPVYANDLAENSPSWLFDIWSEALMNTKEVGGDKLTREEILNLYQDNAA